MSRTLKPEREARRKYEATWREKNRQKRREAVRKYRLAHPERHKEQTRRSNMKRKESLSWRLGSALRRRLICAIKNNQKSGSAVADLGCTINELKFYLESQFQPGMSWDNWGKEGWHIDHKRPLASFDLSDRAQFCAASHYTNLQPLWAADNLKKGKSSA